MKTLFTSNFRLAGKHPHRLNIARETPASFQGDSYLSLAPSHALLERYFSENMPWPEYEALFHHSVLSPLDPYAVIGELPEKAVLLCWCPPHKNCHRRIVAQWLEQSTGASVTELSHNKPLWQLDYEDD